MSLRLSFAAAALCIIILTSCSTISSNRMVKDITPDNLDAVFENKLNNYIENWRRSRDFLSVCRTFDGLQTFAVL